MTEREFKTIIDKLDILEINDKLLTEKLELYAEQLDLYKQLSKKSSPYAAIFWRKIAKIKQSFEQLQKTSDEQINAIIFEIKAY